MTAPMDRIQKALAAASDTRAVRIGAGVIAQTGEVFRESFGEVPAVIVADTNTFAAAGERTVRALGAAGLSVREPILFDGSDLHAREERVIELEQRLAGVEAVPVAVGSGTINDLTKLAAHRCGRRYMAVATAASMDGYTAFGASITSQGSKQTFECPAPVAVLADMDVIALAPAEMNAAGYADLLAKTAAGADWLLADALGIEPLHPQAWALAQEGLREWISRPEGVRRGDPAALRALTEGLMMSGLAMQASQSSRPASGAEHQFSHLWDMQEHRHLGGVPFHGFKVGIGTIASTLLYEELFRGLRGGLDVNAAVAAWPEWEQLAREMETLHARGDLQRLALREMRAKYVDRGSLRERLLRLEAVWPTLRPRLQSQLLTSSELRARLERAGAPCTPEEIGIDLPRLRRSHVEAQTIRRRFTVLDVVTMTGLMPRLLERLFAPHGPWMERG